MRRLCVFFLTCCLICGTAFADTFVPTEPTLSATAVKKGEKGYVKTTVDGNRMLTFPVEAVDVVESPSRPYKSLLVRAMGDEIEKLGGIAEGMSGSPVYFRNKLVGAIGYTWAYADHRIAQVTSIEDMVRVFDYPDLQEPDNSKLAPLKEFLPTAGPWRLSGVSKRTAERLSARTGLTLLAANVSGAGATELSNDRLNPGDPIAVRMAWGDVDMSATGTVTATDAKGRFLAFGHSLEQYGAVQLPASKAQVHLLVPSVELPFKLASNGPIIGSITQDRAEAIGGKFGLFPKANSIRVTLNQTGEPSITKGFQMPQNKVLFNTFFPELLIGLIDDMQNRVGPGTISYDLTVNGPGLEKGLEIHDMALSRDDVAVELSCKVVVALTPLLENPYRDITPLGISLALQTTTQLREAKLSNLQVNRRGDVLDVSFDLLPSFGAPKQTKKLQLQAPEEGISYSVVVRPGNADTFDPDGEEGPSDFAGLVKGLSAGERSCQIVVEVEADGLIADPNGKTVADQNAELTKNGYRKVFQMEALPRGSLRWTPPEQEDTEAEEQ